MPGVRCGLYEPQRPERGDRAANRHPNRNESWRLHTTFGGKLPSEVFREHIIACYVTDPTALTYRDNIAWECDCPHSDSLWPDAPEFVLRELEAADAGDADIDKITWQNACRALNWDPFAHIAAAYPHRAE